MTRRFGLRGAALLMLMLLAGAMLLPAAQADHAYSHRYIVFGRVVDAAGNPVPGVTVNAGSPPGDRHFQPEGGCSDQPGIATEAFGPTRAQPVTNDRGEFIHCFHTHGMSRILPPFMTFGVEGTDAEVELEMDAYTRHSWIPIVLNETRPDANAEIRESSYTLLGTAWRDGGRDENLEGIRVYGYTMNQAPVNITFEYNGKEPIELSTQTNNYGDWSVRVPVEERVESGTVTVTIEGETFTEELDPKIGATYLDTRFEKQGLPAPGFVVVLGMLAAVAVVLAHRRRDDRS